MKRLIFFLLLVFLSCTNQHKPSNRIIFTANYPLKLIIQEIVGDTSIVQCLVPPNVSEHTFEPKVSDIQKLENARIFFYTSQTLDVWAAKNEVNKVEVIKLLPKENLHYFEGDGIDPHFWTSPKTVLSIVDTLESILSEQFPEMRKTIEISSKNFKMKLMYLDSTVSAKLDEIKDRYIFLFHPSFLYLIRDYGLNYGGSLEENPGSEPTPLHISNLINRIKETGTKAIFSEPQLNRHSAEVLAKNAYVNLYVIDPLGSNNVRTYEDFVSRNVQTIYEALK